MIVKNKKKTLVIKMEFDLVDWVDNSYVPSFSEISSTLKLISMFRHTPEAFSKGQVRSITRWIDKNSIDKFVNAKIEAEQEQAILKQDSQFAEEMMWTKRLQTNH